MLGSGVGTTILKKTKMTDFTRFFRAGFFGKKATVKRAIHTAFATLLSAAFVVAPLPYSGSIEAHAAGGTRTLWLHFTHTGEEKKVTFRRNGKYVAEGLKQASWMVRDWRRNQPTKMDPRLFDLVWSVYQESGAKGPIRVVSGFRSKKTNDALRRRSRGVAKFSQHTLGKAMDFYIPGVPVRKLREIGLRMQEGGVGYYPGSKTPFVHMDTGRVRHWPRMTPKQLAAVFPKGKTIHVSTTGRKMPRYSQAMAEYQAKKKKVVQPLSRSKRTQIASSKSKKKRSGGLLAGLFNNGRDKDQSAPKTTPSPKTSKKRSDPKPIVVASKTKKPETKPIPSRIGRAEQAKKPAKPVLVKAKPAVPATSAPIELAAASLPPAPRAVPKGLRDQFTPPSAIVVAGLPAPIERPQNAPTNPTDTPQIVAANIETPLEQEAEASTEQKLPRGIDPTQTAALSRKDFDIPTPQVVQNRVPAESDPTRLVLNEPANKPKTRTLTQGNTATLAYAVSASPADRLPRIDENLFNSRFGKFKIDPRTGQIPLVEAVGTAATKENTKQQAEPTVSDRFAALDAQEIEPPLTLKDFGAGSSRLKNLRKALGLAKSIDTPNPATTTRTALETTPPVPLASPRPRHLASSAQLTNQSITDNPGRFEFKGEGSKIVRELLATASISHETYVHLTLPKPSHMPGLFLNPTRTFAGSFSPQTKAGKKAGQLAGDAISITPTREFTAFNNIQLTWLAR